MRWDAERIAVREALGYAPPHFPLRDHYETSDWMYGNLAHDKLVDSGDWHEALDLHHHRYMSEDIALGLVFLVSVAEWAGVPRAGRERTGGACQRGHGTRPPQRRPHARQHGAVWALPRRHDQSAKGWKHPAPRLSRPLISCWFAHQWAAHGPKLLSKTRTGEPRQVFRRRPLLRSNCVSDDGVSIGRSGPHHRVEHGREFARASDNDGLLRLSSRKEVFLEGPEPWVEPAGHECRETNGAPGRRHHRSARRDLPECPC
ncbi:MAG: NAD/NADP octopine/nopaline dehydrogenase family protein [Paracoccaceae bacterium]